MALDVSGAEFITAFNRIQWVAREILPPMTFLPNTREGAESCTKAADRVLEIMRYSNARGWDLANCIVKQLRAQSGA
jgi:hypothetical protein